MTTLNQDDMRNLLRLGNKIGEDNVKYILNVGQKAGSVNLNNYNQKYTNALNKFIQRHNNKSTTEYSNMYQEYKNFMGGADNDPIGIDSNSQSVDNPNIIPSNIQPSNIQPPSPQSSSSESPIQAKLPNTTTAVQPVLPKIVQPTPTPTPMPTPTPVPVPTPTPIPTSIPTPTPVPTLTIAPETISTMAATIASAIASSMASNKIPSNKSPTNIQPSRSYEIDILDLDIERDPYLNQKKRLPEPEIYTDSIQDTNSLPVYRSPLNNIPKYTNQHKYNMAPISRMGKNSIFDMPTSNPFSQPMFKMGVESPNSEMDKPVDFLLIGIDMVKDIDTEGDMSYQLKNKLPSCVSNKANSTDMIFKYFINRQKMTDNKEYKLISSPEQQKGFSWSLNKINKNVNNTQQIQEELDDENKTKPFTGQSWRLNKYGYNK